MSTNEIFDRLKNSFSNKLNQAPVKSEKISVREINSIFLEIIKMWNKEVIPFILDSINILKAYIWIEIVAVILFTIIGIRSFNSLWFLLPAWFLLLPLLLAILLLVSLPAKLTTHFIHKVEEVLDKITKDLKL